MDENKSLRNRHARSLKVLGHMLFFFFQLPFFVTHWSYSQLMLLSIGSLFWLFIYTTVHHPSHWMDIKSIPHGLVVIHIKFIMLSLPQLRSVSAVTLSVTDLNHLNKFSSSITGRFHSLLCRLWSTVLAHASVLIVIFLNGSYLLAWKGLTDDVYKFSR